MEYNGDEDPLAGLYEIMAETAAQRSAGSTQNAQVVLPIDEVDIPTQFIPAEPEKPQARQPRASTGLYPWDKWLDGKQHTVVQGVDFRTELEVFRITLANTVRRRRKFVTTYRDGDKLTFQVFASKDAMAAKKYLDSIEEYDDGYGDAGPEED